MRESIRSCCIRLFRNRGGQVLLARIVSQLDLWRGYGAGAYVARSGESVLLALLRNRTDPTTETTIFDVGANVGDFTAASLEAVGHSSKVHAFEPAKEVCRQLADRFATDSRVIVNNLALGRETGELPLYGTTRDSGMASLLNRNLNHLGASASFQEMVKVCRLGDYCVARKISKIDLLKMDVEGFELEVLAGAETLFENGLVAMCSFEFGGCNLDSRTFLRDFFEFFSKHGMKIHRITPSGTLVQLERYAENLERFTTTNYVALRDECVNGSPKVD